MTENPWLVKNIQDFSYLNCPECSFKEKEENLFKKHAIRSHPLSSVLFGNKSLTDFVQTIKIEEHKIATFGVSQEKEKTLEELMFPDLELPEPNEDKIYRLPTKFHVKYKDKPVVVSESKAKKRKIEELSKDPKTKKTLTTSKLNEESRKSLKAEKTPLMSITSNEDYCDDNFEVASSNCDKKLEDYQYSDDLGESYQCVYCDFVGTDGALLDHEKTNHYRCKSCDFVTTDESILIDHNQEQHVKKTKIDDLLLQKTPLQLIQKFKCPHCDFSCSLKSSLEYHIKLNHKDGFKCPYCPISYRRKGTLTQHIKKKHKDGKDGKDPKGNKENVSKVVSMNNIAVVNYMVQEGNCVAKKYSCRLCSMFFESEDKVQSHYEAKCGRDMGSYRRIVVKVKQKEQKVDGESREIIEKEVEKTKVKQVDFCGNIVMKDVNSEIMTKNLDDNEIKIDTFEYIDDESILLEKFKTDEDDGIIHVKFS